MHRKNLVAALAAAALAGTAFAGAGTALADEPAAKPKVGVLAKGLVSPLSVAVSENGTVYYSQNFAGSLHAKKPGKKARTIYSAPVPGTEVGAVSERLGSLRFALTLPPADETTPPDTVLMGIGGSGKAKALANLSRYEANKNPDGDVVYGLRGLPEDCEVPEDLQPYPGIVESHPYATTQTKGRTYVADAAGNSILKLGKGGKLSTVAVLPAQPITVTEELAGGFGFPECAVGLKYYFEAVPTDVEKGPDGKLYVTTLPGGPEDPSLGARGAVYRVDPKSGKTKLVAAGLMSPTGVAVSPKGTLYVAQLFGAGIAKVKPGKQPTTYLSTSMPGDVELRTNGDLYATSQVLYGPSEEDPEAPPGGQVIRIRR